MWVRTLATFILPACLAMTAWGGAHASPQNADHCFTAQTFPAFENRALLATMARGVNLPNWDADDIFYRPDLSTLRRLYESGFTHIRLPVFHEAFNTGDWGSEDLSKYSTELLAMLENLLAIGFTVTVDLHPDGTFNHVYRTAPEEGYRRLEDSWRHLSSVLDGTSPAEVALEFLNEPDTSPEIWEDHTGRLSRKLREWLPDHTFVVGPHGPMRHESLANFPPLTDGNTVYAIHFYDPFLFTHQGAEWHPPDDTARLATGIPFPTKENDARIRALVSRLQAEGHEQAAEEIRRIFEEPWIEKDVQNAFSTIENWSQKHGLPVVMNEFGVLSYDAPRNDRLYWLQTVTREAEARCIGWTHWDYSDGFGIVDPHSQALDEEAINALLQRPASQRAD
jgi:endoglucanase